jgi:GNAT superfamily N-acetyltransferase
MFLRQPPKPHLEDEHPPKIGIKPCRGDFHRQMIDLLLRRYKEVGVELALDGLNKDLTDLDRYWRDEGGEFVVLLDDGKVVGCLGAKPIEERGRAEFNYFYLDPAYEGKGYSAPLYRWGLKWAIEHNIRIVELWSGQNRTRAHHLYRSLGFVHNGVRRQTQRNPDYYALYFELQVTPALLSRLQNRFDRLP